MKLHPRTRTMLAWSLWRTEGPVADAFAAPVLREQGPIGRGMT